MNPNEQSFFFALLAFVVGVALGRIWERLTAHHPEARKRIGESIHYILGLDYLASRQLDRAIAELTRAARADTEAIEIYLILGNLLREKGHLERAIQIHQSILHRPGISSRERAYALLCLGIDFKRAGFPKRAIETLEEVARLDPGNPYAMMHLLKLHEEEHDWEEALALQQKVDSLGGESDSTLTAFLHDQLGQSAMTSNEDKIAARNFDAAIRYDRNLPPPYLHYGDLLASQGRHSEAAAQWESLVQVSPEHAYLAFEKLERAYAQVGDPNRIERVYHDVMKRDPEDWRAHLALAKRLAGEGKTAEALELLKQAAQNNPHAVGVHLEALGVLLGEGFSVEALRAYLDQLRSAVFFIDPHICTKCQYRADGLLWRCPHCQEWNSFVEERIVPPRH